MIRLGLVAEGGFQRMEFIRAGGGLSSLVFGLHLQFGRHLTDTSRTSLPQDGPGASLSKSVQNRRPAPRVSAESDPTVPDRVNFIASDVEGIGRIVNMSTSGALIGRPTRNLNTETEADFYFLWPGTKQLLQARARVVRSEGSGFAVQFMRIESDLERLIHVAAEMA